MTQYTLHSMNKLKNIKSTSWYCNLHLGCAWSSTNFRILKAVPKVPYKLIVQYACMIYMICWLGWLSGSHTSVFEVLWEVCVFQHYMLYCAHLKNIRGLVGCVGIIAFWLQQQCPILRACPCISTYSSCTCIKWISRFCVCLKNVKIGS